MNPFRIEGPALISFSGGRTSAFMLHEIIAAHGGHLPQNVAVCFANTGKERPETLDFVQRCGERWSIVINWVEWRGYETIFARVGHNSASRNGEPFSALIAKKQRLPNWQERWCTQYLKVLPMFAFMYDEFGLSPGEFTEIIGLRADEAPRLFKGMERAEKDGRKVAYPLAKAKVTRADVMAFWARQPFDLGLRPYEGNCDLCFMKGRGIRKRLIRDNPDCAMWWDAEEQRQGGFFDRRDRVAELVSEVERTPMLNFDDDTEHDVECGLHCAAE